MPDADSSSADSSSADSSQPPAEPAPAPADADSSQPPAAADSSNADSSSADSSQPPAAADSSNADSSSADSSQPPAADSSSADSSSADSSSADSSSADSAGAPTVTGSIAVDPDDGNAQHPRSVQAALSSKLTLSWSSTNAASVEIEGLGASLGASGSQSIPTQDATYSLVAVGSDGTRSDALQLMVATHGDNEVCSPHAEISAPDQDPSQTTTEPNSSQQPQTTTTQAPVDTTTASPDPQSTTTQAPSETTTANASYNTTTTRDPNQTTTEPPNTTTAAGSVPVVTQLLGFTDKYPQGSAELEVEPDAVVTIKWSVSDDTKEAFLTPSMSTPSSEKSGEASVTCIVDATASNPGVYSFSLTAKNDAGTSAPTTISIKCRAAKGEVDLNVPPWQHDCGEVKAAYVTFKMAASATLAVKFTAEDPTGVDKSSLMEKVEAWLLANDTITQIKQGNWSLTSEAPKLTAQWTPSQGGKLSIDYALKMNPLGVALTASAVLAAVDTKGTKNAFTIGSLELELAKEYTVDVDITEGVKMTGSLKFAATGAAEPNWPAILKQMGAQVAIDVAITAGFIAGGVATIVTVWKGIEEGAEVREAGSAPEAAANAMADGVAAGFSGGSAPSGDAGAAGFKYGIQKLGEYKAQLKASSPDSTDDEVNQAASDAITAHSSDIRGWAYDSLLPLCKQGAWDKFVAGHPGDESLAKNVWVAMHGHLPAKSRSEDAPYFKAYPDAKDFS